MYFENKWPDSHSMCWKYSRGWILIPINSELEIYFGILGLSQNQGVDFNDHVGFLSSTFFKTNLSSTTCLAPSFANFCFAMRHKSLISISQQSWWWTEELKRIYYLKWSEYAECIYSQLMSAAWVPYLYSVPPPDGRQGQRWPGLYDIREGLQDRVGRRCCCGKIQLPASPLQERIQIKLQRYTGWVGENWSQLFVAI